MSAAVTSSGGSAPAASARCTVSAEPELRAGVRTELEREPRAVADELLHLLGEVSRDDEDALATGGGELAQQRRDHGPAVDRQDRLRPALGQRTETAALSRGHHHGVASRGEPKRAQGDDAADTITGARFGRAWRA